MVYQEGRSRKGISCREKRPTTSRTGIIPLPSPSHLPTEDLALRHRNHLRDPANYPASSTLVSWRTRRGSRKLDMRVSYSSWSEEPTGTAIQSLNGSHDSSGRRGSLILRWPFIRCVMAVSPSCTVPAVLTMSWNSWPDTQRATCMKNMSTRTPSR
jgi:hypothetical protein